jgi:hypothetical protein
MRLGQLMTGLLLASLAGFAYAQTAARVSDIQRSSIVGVLERIPVRESPPTQGTVYSPGRQVATLNQGETLEVTDIALFKNVLGSQKWLQLRRTAGSPSLGWIYAGDEGKQSCCVELKQAGGS